MRLNDSQSDHYLLKLKIGVLIPSLLLGLIWCFLPSSHVLCMYVGFFLEWACLSVFLCVCFLTFDHDHVDVYGANGRLGQALPFLQDVWDFSRGDAVIWFASECHQLPDGHAWMMFRRENQRQRKKVRQRVSQQVNRQIRGWKYK